jgi:hypothetical protein
MVPPTSMGAVIVNCPFFALCEWSEDIGAAVATPANARTNANMAAAIEACLAMVSGDWFRFMVVSPWELSQRLIRSVRRRCMDNQTPCRFIPENQEHPGFTRGSTLNTLRDFVDLQFAGIKQAERGSYRYAFRRITRRAMSEIRQDMHCMAWTGTGIVAVSSVFGATTPKQRAKGFSYIQISDSNAGFGKPVITGSAAMALQEGKA